LLVAGAVANEGSFASWSKESQPKIILQKPVIARHLTLRGHGEIGIRSGLKIYKNTLTALEINSRALLLARLKAPYRVAGLACGPLQVAGAVANEK